MPRASLGARLWFDPGRQNWVIRDGRKFIRTGATGWRNAEARFHEYMKTQPLRHPIPEPIVGFVYFLTADAPEFPIKIGFTQKRGDLRSKAIQTGCPFKVITLGMFPGGYKDERDLHKRFAGQRLEGEWFKRSPELMAVVEASIKGIEAAR